MAKCEICGKTPLFGHNVSKSKIRTNREFRPNIQATTLLVDGKLVKVKACANCLKTLSKNAKI